ncbi:putative HD superfamily hydrolase involved in NAD metabolism [Desulfitobacterium dehalogenans ATCC 51507]|uniref:Putative HD superfamily hydrolase involved in NAD metabolism n=1 Tax=Desulfitobacterium dehalogenans (strain ATCC 51507 / DSM 9161 / JW/IU-DC1) TaxID=756499 RepID=I4A5S6_DESDJ|nr:HD domain-containing protein [Desulfitobacterium dehalogenans]AFL99310.1 putative HD superfamily hydrolase involved in NAD metabolism [Desulfitobacterium dehalogenans ATCC 51507]
MYKEGLPALDEAQMILEEASQLNPGPWVQHSIYTAQAAQIIASNCKELDSKKAYILGMLHDIGRRFGVTNMRHSLDGYTFSIGKGYDVLGKICLTHSCPTKNMREAFGKWDCSNEEYAFVESYLRSVVYDDYDRLIQLCDALALPSGFSLMEKRMIDVALRHGLHEYIIPKWKATFEIKQYLEKLIGTSIYSLLPGVVENTFNN